MNDMVLVTVTYLGAGVLWTLWNAKSHFAQTQYEAAKEKGILGWHYLGAAIAVATWPLGLALAIILEILGAWESKKLRKFKSHSLNCRALGMTKEKDHDTNPTRGHDDQHRTPGGQERAERDESSSGAGRDRDRLGSQGGEEEP